MNPEDDPCEAVDPLASMRESLDSVSYLLSSAGEAIGNVDRCLEPELYGRLTDVLMAGANGALQLLWHIRALEN